MRVNIHLEDLSPVDLMFIATVLSGRDDALREKNVQAIAHVEPDTDLPLQEVPEEITPEPVKAAEPPLDLETVRGVLNKLKQDKGTAAVRDLLSRFGAKSVPELKPEAYNELVDAVGVLYSTEEE